MAQAKNSYEFVPVPPQVLAFLSKASDLIAFDAGEGFNQRTFCDFSDYEIESPIEQILYTALKAVRQLANIPDGDVISLDGKDFVFGLGIWPQRTIGAYRVDFEVSYHSWPRNGAQKVKTVLVECDSQQWHERTEEERRYEKRRDRDLTAKGYRVLHFTGKEILENPYLVACEVLVSVDPSPRPEHIYEVVENCLAVMEEQNQ